VGDRQHIQWQFRRLGLRFEKRAPHAMHRYPVEGSIDGGH
jgi:hypothetical protein